MKDYIGFRDATVAPSRRTRIVEVFSRRDDGMLGLIKWHAPWRCYVLITWRDVVWSPDCLQRVADEAQAMTDAHRRLVRERRR